MIFVSIVELVTSDTDSAPKILHIEGNILTEGMFSAESSSKNKDSKN